MNYCEHLIERYFGKESFIDLFLENNAITLPLDNLLSLTMWEHAGQSLEGINLADLKVNQAYLNITSHLPHRIWVYSLSENCIRCPFTKNREIGLMGHILMKFDASRQIAWKFFDEDHGKYAFNNVTSFCTIIPNDIGMFGVYNIGIEDDKCSFEVTLSPVNIYLSLLFALLILAFGIIMIYTSNRCYKRYKRSRQSSSEINLETEPEKPNSTKPRLRSLDTFRGTAIVLMIFVNSGGGDYWWIEVWNKESSDVFLANVSKLDPPAIIIYLIVTPLEHATWNGLHVADLVFPWFLWIMGVCIPISIKSQIARNASKKDIILTILTRSVKLFLIGLFLNTSRGPPLEEIRIMGVLQRFGIAYFVVATIHVLYVKPINILPNGKVKRALYDIYVLIYQWIAIMCITLIHFILIFGFRVPGCPRGYLGPGGKQDKAEFKNCIGGATGYIDRMILGEKHIYQHPTARYTYDSQPFDPEGLVGCLTTILQTFIGLQCGSTLMVFTEWKARVRRFLIWALALGLLSGILCLFSQDDGFIPINKNLWSLSYVFATSSLAFILLTFFYFIIDVRNLWSGTPLVYAGMNALVMYVGHSIIHSMLPWHWHIGLMNTHFMLLLENMWNASIWVVVAYYMYCKKIFISV